MKAGIGVLSVFVFALGAGGLAAQEAGGQSPILDEKTGESSPVKVSPDEQLMWDSIGDSSNSTDFEVFLRIYPDSVYAPLAQERLTGLAGKAVPEPSEAVVENLPSKEETPVEPSAGGQASEPVGTAASKPEDKPAAKPASKPIIKAAAPLQQSRIPLEVETIAGTYVVQCNANLRQEATSKSSRIKLLLGGDAVQVTGKVKGKNWYRVKSPTGQEGFVFGMLLREDKKKR